MNITKGCDFLRVALYIRTSTENQAESITLQTEELKRYCKIKDYEIVEIYKDFGFTGKNTKRPAFSVMLQDAEEKKFDMILVTKIDRFARSVLDLLLTVEKLQEYEIQFAATSQPIDTSSAMGRLTLQIMGAFAEFERTIIRERMETGRKAAARNGTICNRPRKDISKTKVINLLEKDLSANAIAKFMEVDTATITNRLAEWGYVYKNGQWIKQRND